MLQNLKHKIQNPKGANNPSKNYWKNNQQVANISGTFKPPPRVTGRKDPRDVNESKLSKWELRKAKNIETQSSEIRSTSQQSFSQQTANSVYTAK